MKLTSVDKCYLIRNATIVTSPISILVLDEYDRIVAECCHNAAESLFLWYKKNKNNIEHTLIEKAMFTGVQQRFNMGHWFIDTVPLIDYGISCYEGDHRELVMITDTIDHELIKDTLDYYEFSKRLSSLPQCTISAGELYIPVIESFQKRCLKGAEIIKEIYPKKETIKTNELKGKHERCRVIYLSRKYAPRRRIINQLQLESILYEHDIPLICPEDYNKGELRNIIDFAEIIICDNGGGIANVLLANEVESKELIVIYPNGHLDDYYCMMANRQT